LKLTDIVDFCGKEGKERLTEKTVNPCTVDQREGCTVFEKEIEIPGLL
jgi:hypothetical protein